jgi:hypothetical protein
VVKAEDFQKPREKRYLDTNSPGSCHWQRNDSEKTQNKERRDLSQRIIYIRGNFLFY